MLKLAKHAVAVAVLIAAASAPVASDTPSLSYTHLAVTYIVQDDHSQDAMQPR